MYLGQNVLDKMYRDKMYRTICISQNVFGQNVSDKLYLGQNVSFINTLSTILLITIIMLDLLSIKLYTASDYNYCSRAKSHRDDNKSIFSNAFVCESNFSNMYVGQEPTTR